MAYVQVRIDENVKNKAAKIIALGGLKTSDVVRVVLTHIANTETLPLDFFLPNQETLEAIRQCEAGETIPTTIDELMQIIKDAQTKKPAKSKSRKAVYA